MSAYDEIRARMPGLPLAALIEIARGEPDEDLKWGAILELHRRGGEEEYQAALTLSESGNVQDREAAAHILGELGNTTDLSSSACVDVLLRLAADEDPTVLAAAARALSHRDDLRSVGPLIGLASHGEASVRLGVVHGLSGKNHPDAIATLIDLTSDPVDDIRDWAAFSLGQLSDADTPDLRDALRRRLTDANEDVRAEALCGLVRRKNAQAIALLAKLVEGNGQGLQVCHFDAIIELGDVSFLPKLLALRAAIDGEDIDCFWASSLDGAIDSLERSKMGLPQDSY